jgi:hypothetical protein
MQLGRLPFFNPVVLGVNVLYWATELHSFAQRLTHVFVQARGIRRRGKAYLHLLPARGTMAWQARDDTHAAAPSPAHRPCGSAQAPDAPAFDPQKRLQSRQKFGIIEYNQIDSISSHENHT